MAALDLFGRRWNLRIVWELRHGPVGFRALQQRCDNTSSSVLRQRLTELLDARLVAQQPDAAYGPPAVQVLVSALVYASCCPCHA
jgi:DNA-binding HxlR family transcriptional regulator